MSFMTLHKAGNLGRADLTGIFGAPSYKDITQMINAFLIDPEIEYIVLNFSEAIAIDSTGLGMLLEIQSKSRSSGKQIELSNCSGQVKEILTVANFQKIFTITYV